MITQHYLKMIKVTEQEASYWAKLKVIPNQICIFWDLHKELVLLISYTNMVLYLQAIHG